MSTANLNPLPGVPWVESPLFNSLFREGEHPPAFLGIARDLHTKGYAVIDFPDTQFDQRADGIIERLGKAFALQTGTTQLHPTMRVTDGWVTDSDIMALAANAEVLDLLARLYGRKAWPFQTLNFPMGTEQHYHTDSVHFSSVPERFMCGVWIALEDIGPEQGPLQYYPGSHRWPIYTNEHVGYNYEVGTPASQGVFHPMWQAMVEATGIQREIFCARKGQALIWTANLLHGGIAHLDVTKTRWSQVTHYYFDDCVYYTPMTSEPFRGLISYREPLNIITGQRNHASCQGIPLGREFVDAARVGLLSQIPLLLGAYFDGDAYLRAYPDVAAGNHDPWEHYVHNGRYENRRFFPKKLP